MEDSKNPSKKGEHGAWPRLYRPDLVEPIWQDYWERREVYEAAYRFDEDDVGRTVFIIDTPPPFTSGELHMGHAYWNIINDALSRYQRMRGRNVLLPQGWDCQGLPTELKVQYIWSVSKEDREKFREKCVEWTHDMIRSMKEVMKRLGYRPDWERFEYRTMDSSYWRAVQLSLLEFFERGLIYRAEFPVHWCPRCETALAQAELGYVSEEATLYHIRFPIQGGYLEIATTRPELLPACQALSIHPGDERYRHLVGGEAEIPLFQRKVPILEDEDVDPSFGTGIVMVCTFGDEQDIRWQQKYSLPVTKALDEKGRLMNAGKYDGLSIMEAREAMLGDLEEKGLLARREAYSHQVLSHTDRPDCMSPIEFLVKKQWLIRIMPYREEVKEACRDMRWVPGHMLQRLMDWVDSIEWDWVISRQRIYGTPIPFWYCEECGEIMAPSRNRLPVNPAKDPPPTSNCPRCGSEAMRGTEDVCDCWIDSSITPLIVSRRYSGDGDFHSKTYPSDVRQQGHDIIRTWLFYTVLRCLILTGKPPFGEVLVNGMILGPDGHRMSKSKGNVVSPVEGLDEYGADALRQALLSLNVGYDFPFKWEVVRYGKAFLQKLWSASRFAYPFVEDYETRSDDEVHLTTVDKWILAQLRRTIEGVTGALEDRRFHHAIETIQNFFWHKFCDQYLETVKHRLYGEGVAADSSSAKYTLYKVLWSTIRMISPICPHIAEEIYHRIFEGEGYVTVHAAPWPEALEVLFDEEAERRGEIVIGAISRIRSEKAKAGIRLSAPLESVTIGVPEEMVDALREGDVVIRNTLNIESLTYENDVELRVKLSPQ